MTAFLIIVAGLLGLIIVLVKGFGAGFRAERKPGSHNNWRRPDVEVGNRPAYDASEGGDHGGSVSGGGAE